MLPGLYGGLFDGMHKQRQRLLRHEGAQRTSAGTAYDRSE